MAHEIEGNRAAFHLPTWHGMGTVVDHAMTAEEALTLADMSGWRVAKVPMFYISPETGKTLPVPDNFASVRLQDDRCFGVVGNRFEMVQNEEVVRLIDSMMAEGFKFESLFSLYGGKKCVALLHNPLFDIELPDSTIKEYIFVSWAHDGTGAIMIANTPVRVVCANTLSMALNNRCRTVTVRHTPNWANKRAEIERVLGLAKLASQQIEETGLKMLNEKISDSDFKTFLDTLVPVPADPGRGQTMAENVQAGIRTQYHRPEESSIHGTTWGAWQSVVAFNDHDRQQRGTDSERADNRLASTIWAPKGNLSERALALLA